MASIRGLSPDGLAQLVELTEARAYADLFRDAPTSWGVRLVESEVATVLIAPMLDIPLFNRAIGLGLGTSVGDDELDSTIRLFDDAGVRNFAIQISPAAKLRASQSLSERNLFVRDNWAKVARSSEAAEQVQTDLTVDRIGSDDAEAFAQVAVTAFRMPQHAGAWLRARVGQPGWHHYLARDQGVPVATAALYVRDGAGWLGIGSTLPSHRRRGAQGALMVRRIEDGRDLGCRCFVTETGEDLPSRPNPSFHNMMRTGFTLVYQRPNFMRPLAGSVQS
jgi:acetyltransferase (GNAT) family protein